jgi:hypothetical protein
MPYKFEYKHIHLPKSKDRRVKIPPCKYTEIRELYSTGKLSYQKIGDMYGVSKSLIIHIVNPDIAEKKRRQHAERRKDGRYYVKEKHTVAIREHRNYKKNVLKKEHL